ncbi:hypothetical protein M011DRAFT_450681 [Sporormia fimetaria CBS 119925]|uniref:Phosphatidylinositol N-acetylglucosaminyltransferase subunit H conserved domain-containing protein n=1 Tax=Sporormia fimetaria CBS 119925 TaxID=1340428 RepID=A0A6A6V3B6_9PLEO|nr:hypothetical protein M011DRAFT_450681 [Sporormia fimetaria CBS 119925]
MEVPAALLRLRVPPKLVMSVFQPTTSTIRYAISTHPPPTSVLGRVWVYVLMFLRIALGVLALGVVGVKWDLTRPRSWVSKMVRGEDAAWLAEQLVGLQWRYLLPVAAVVVYLVLRRGYIEESLLVIRGLGLQTSTSSPWYLVSATTRFIPTTSIQDVFVHEAFIGFGVRFYLAIVVKDELDVVIGFPRLLPRLHMLEEVWNGARGVLWGHKKGVKVDTRMGNKGDKGQGNVEAFPPL